MSEAVHIDMYKASVPVVLNALTNLKTILGKAEAWAAEKNVKEATVLNARLALDMLPFSKQIQLVSDTAKGLAARLGGVENPSYADDEATFAETARAPAKDDRFRQIGRRQGLCWFGNARNCDEVPEPQHGVHGLELPDRLRYSQPVFPRHNGLCHSASFRRTAR